ncbi:MAG: AAA family ATPase [Oscillospiraceae bacterium]|nr:AAA family ATPase [Oscillospiraceae bacterium]
MFINSFTGNRNTVLSLAESIKSSGLSHAMLIFAKEGCGANFFAKLLAADIINGNEADLRLINEEAHQQVQIIKGSGASGQIKVDSVRAINENVNFSSLGGEKRVVIIQNCENFNTSSANALLKNLEEPKDDITYILTTTDTSKILSTIRSRCQMYSLSQPTMEQAREYFADFDSAEKEEIISIYNGNIGMVKDALESPKRFEILQRALKAQKCIQNGDDYALAKLMYSFNKKKDELVLFFKDMEYICAANLSPSAIAVLNAVTSAKNAMERNANLALVMQNFIIAVS